MGKPRHQKIRRECRAIAAALDRLETRMLRMFPGGEGKPGNDDPVPETLIGIAQASAYVGMIPAMSDAGIDDALLRHSALATPAGGEEGR